MPQPKYKRKSRKVKSTRKLLNNSDRRSRRRNSANATSIAPSLDVTDHAHSSSIVETMTHNQSNQCGSDANLISTSTVMDDAPLSRQHQNGAKSIAPSLDVTGHAHSSSIVETVTHTQSNQCGSGANLLTTPTVMDYESLSSQQLPNASIHSFENPLFHKLRDAFTVSLKKVNELHCTNCNEKLFVNYKPRVARCRRCSQPTMASKFSSDNNMDPGPIVQQLSSLSPVERLLIAQVVPNMAIFRLPRGGQFGCSGHVINIPQDVNEFITELPRRVEQLDILVLKRSSRQAELPPSYFTVNRQKVYDALLWLKDNNVYYSDININMRNLEVLPVDGVLHIPRENLQTEDDDGVPVSTEQPVPANNVLEEATTVSIDQSFIPRNMPVRRENEIIQTAINDGDVWEWPQQYMNDPINEFTTVGYIAKAFPHLFPTGKADLRAPRNIRVTPHEYFRHMLAFHDKRFEAEPRFVFLAYNSMLRWQSLQVGRVYVKNNPNDAAMTVEEIRQLVQSDQNNISKHILRFGNQIRGTPQYWFRQKSNLLAMVKQLGTAQVFFTFSVADHKWPDLQKFIAAEGYSVSELIAHHPHTVDSYLFNRFKLFFASVLTPYMDIKDYWFRCEWQNRGSLHIHGLAWIPGAPDPAVCLPSEIVAFWDKFVSSWNTAIEINDNPVNFFWPVDVHPCSLTEEQVQDFDEDLKNLINVCQKHTRCSPNYCLRSLPDGRQGCRFGFPKTLREATTAEFTLDDNGDRVKLDVLPATNDPLLNKYNPYCLSIYRANMDISVTLRMTDVANYIAKYASKAEKATTDYCAVFRQLVSSDLPHHAPMLKAAGALLNKTIGNMDVSAQQAVHIVSGLNLFECSRHFAYCYVDGLVVQDELHNPNSSDIRNYTNRPTTHDNLSFLQVLSSFTISAKDGAVHLRPRKGGEAIVSIMPSYKPDPMDSNFMNYCSQYLMLHKPFRQFKQLMSGFHDSIAAYSDFVRVHPDPACAFHVAIEEAVEEIENEERLVPEEHMQEMWMGIVTNLHPNNQPEILPVNVDGGNSALYDWVGESTDFHHLINDAKNFLVTQQPSHRPETNCNVSLLNAEQRRVYKHITSVLSDNTADEVVRAMVMGTAGTGKSFLINCIQQHFGDGCRVLAPTGVAALNVGGETIHSFLQFAKVHQISDLKGPSLQKIQQKCRGVKLFVFDELSMIGTNLLHAIDKRLRQGYPTKADEFFGGASVVMFGDLGQLPPVGDARMFRPNVKDVHSVQGHAAYKQFKTIFSLTVSVRQSHDQSFRDTLNHLRDGNTTLGDYTLLSSRFSGICSTEAFQGATRLFPTRAAVETYNDEKLNRLGTPKAYIEALHNIPSAKSASSDTACGLSKFCPLAVGARVILRVNLSVTKGLVNGSIGQVVQIVYLSSAGPPSLPDMVICTFSGYTGPPFIENIPNSFPIQPIERMWFEKGRIHSRKNIPLSLAWALTIHKAQGVTLDQAVVDIGETEMSAGISFVAMSRVRQLANMVLSPFSYDRLTSLKNMKSLRERLDEEQRLAEFEIEE